MPPPAAYTAADTDMSCPQIPGVTEVPKNDLQAFIAAMFGGKAAAVPGLSAARGSSLLGRGACAAVYRAKLAASGAAGGLGEELALKVATPAAPWEFAAVRALVSRVHPRYAPLFMPARAIFLSVEADAEAAAGQAKRAALAPKSSRGLSSLSVLAMPLGADGTLLELVNAYKTGGRELGATLVLYLSLQLLMVCLPGSPACAAQRGRCTGMPHACCCCAAWQMESFRSAM